MRTEEHQNLLRSTHEFRLSHGSEPRRPSPSFRSGRSVLTDVVMSLVLVLRGLRSHTRRLFTDVRYRDRSIGPFPSVLGLSSSLGHSRTLFTHKPFSDASFSLARHHPGEHGEVLESERYATKYLLNGVQFPSTKVTRILV